MSRVRRTAGSVLVVVAVSLAPAGAEEVYRWTDEDGTVHYSNVGGPDEAETEEVRMETPPGPERSPEGGAREPETSPSGEGPSPKGDETGKWADLADGEFSTLVSQTRRDLRREIDRKQERIAEIDAELAGIESAQAQAMGTVGRLQGQPRAGPVESDEAKELREEREELQQEIADLREEYDELREEAVRRYGSLPGWWLPLR